MTERGRVVVEDRGLAGAVGDDGVGNVVRFRKKVSFSSTAESPSTVMGTFWKAGPPGGNVDVPLVAM